MKTETLQIKFKLFDFVLTYNNLSQDVFLLIKRVKRQKKALDEINRKPRSKVWRTSLVFQKDHMIRDYLMHQSISYVQKRKTSWSEEITTMNYIAIDWCFDRKNWVIAANQIQHKNHKIFGCFFDFQLWRYSHLMGTPFSITILESLVRLLWGR